MIASDRVRHWLQVAAASAQVAGLTALRIGAGIARASFDLLDTVAGEARLEGLVSALLTPLPSQYRDTSARAAFYSTVLETSEEAFGSGRVALTSGSPLGGTAPGPARIRIVGKDDSESQVDRRAVSEGLFGLLHVPALEGRGFDRADRTAIVSNADTSQPLSELDAGEVVRERELSTLRLTMSLGGLLASLAALLAMVGIGGMVLQIYMQHD